MAKHAAHVGTLTIASGQTASNIIQQKQMILGDTLIFVTPSALTGTVTVWGALTNEGTLSAIQYEATSMTLTAAKLQVWRGCGLRQIQVKSGSSEGADRVFEVYIEENL